MKRPVIDSDASFKETLLSYQTTCQQLGFLASQGLSGLQTSLAIRPHREFEQYKPYQSGDPVALVDWRRYCKTKDLLVRYGSQESIGRLRFVIDQSSSMNEGSLQHRGWTKTLNMRLLVGILSLMTSRQDDQWALSDLADGSSLLAFGSGKGQFDQTLALLKPKPSKSSKQNNSFGRIPSDLIITFTDGYSSLEAWKNQLQYWRQAEPAAQSVVIILETDGELQANFKNSLYVDPEALDQKPLIFRGKKARDSYLTRRGEHFASIEETSRTYAIKLLRLNIDSPLEHNLSSVVSWIEETSR